MTIKDTTWRGAKAWLITDDDLEIVVTVTGGHIAALRIPGEDLNPMWQPSWEAFDPADTAAYTDLLGPAPDGPLLATIVGHSFCLDRFGAPWPGENKPVHGETGVVDWTLSETGEKSFAIATTLPEAALRIHREMTFRGTNLVVETTVRHDKDAPVDVEWAEHVTLGDPFIDGALFSADIDGAWMAPGIPAESSRYPDAGPAGPVRPVDPSGVLDMPTSTDAAKVGDMVSTRLVKGGFRAERRDLGRVLEYDWDAEEYPWLFVWTENRSLDGSPWNGETRGRALEFSTKPFNEGKPPEERATAFRGRPTICTVPPGNAGLRRSFTLSWRQV